MAAERVHVFKDDAGEWRWVKRAANGEIVADSSEGYTRKADALEAARREHPDLLIDVEGSPSEA